ncbi:MAG TPA: hypothetical protein PLQ57_02985 [Saprospiraceae bacterium]|nr:hypothetical protein [Saprospiraceae bacterium]
MLATLNDIIQVHTSLKIINFAQSSKEKTADLRQKKQIISILLSFFIFAASLLGGPKIEFNQHQKYNKAEWVKSDTLSLKAILEKDVKSIHLDQVRTDHVPSALAFLSFNKLLFTCNLAETDNLRYEKYAEGSAIVSQNIRRVLFPFHSHW